VRLNAADAFATAFVVHPVFGGEPMGLDFAVGIQRLVAKRLEASGRPSLFALARVPVHPADADPDAAWKTGDMTLAPIEAWPEDALATLLVDRFGAHWGVVPEFHAVGGTCRLVTRLFEVGDDARPHEVDAWTFEGENLALPEHLVQLVDGLAARTGTRSPWTTVTEMFGTAEPIPALYHLRALGYCSQLEESCRVDRRQVLATLCMILDIAPQMESTRELVPDVVLALARAGVADGELEQWLHQLRQRAGAGAWPGLLEEARAVGDRVD